MKQLIIAGPGAGKTRLISDTVKELVSGDLANPDRIYAVSFTREASSELANRIDIEQVNTSTIHSLAGRILSTRSSSYNDLISKAANYSGKLPDVDFIAIDEAQDLTRKQYLFLNKIVSVARNVLIVGDPMQSIYGFSGGSPEFMSVDKWNNSLEEVSLNKSHRLPEVITESINHVFQTNIEPANDGGIFKVITNKGVNCPDTEKETGILFRTNGEVMKFVRNESKKINCIVQLSYHPIVSLAVCIKSLNTDIDMSSMEKTSYLSGIKYREMASLSYRFAGITANSGRISYDNLEEIKDRIPDYHQDKKTIKRFIMFMKLFKHLRKSPSEDVINEIYEMGYAADNLWSDIMDKATDNKRILAYAVDNQLTTGNDTPFRVFTGSKYTAMTVHSAKGLEFDRVMYSISDESRFFSDEEKRIAYVAMTRAKEELEVYINKEDFMSPGRAKMIKDLMLTQGKI